MNLFTLFGEVMLGLLEGAYLNFKELIISLRFGAPILGLLSEICSPCLFFCAVRLNSICYLVSSRVDCDCFFIPCYLGALSSICRVFESEGALRVLPAHMRPQRVVLEPGALESTIQTFFKLHFRARCQWIIRIHHSRLLHVVLD